VCKLLSLPASKHLAYQLPPVSLVGRPVIRILAMAATDKLEAGMHFLVRDPKYMLEKPYTLRYAPAPEDGIPQTNIDRVQYQLQFHDLRNFPELTYDKCGFTVTECPSRMTYEDFADADKIEQVHGKEVTEAVMQALGAKSVELLDYVVPHLSPTEDLTGICSWGDTGPETASHVANCDRRQIRFQPACLEGAYR
jgi:hypothetical protein